MVRTVPEKPTANDPMENFRRYVDDSANLLALDLAALLDRAYSLGISVVPDVDYEEGTSYSIEWAFKTPRCVDVEWDPKQRRWIVTKGNVEGMPQNG